MPPDLPALRTAREDIRVPFGLAVAMARQDVAMVDEVLDEIGCSGER